MYLPRKNSLISGRASIHCIVSISARAVHVRSPNWLWAPSANMRWTSLLGESGTGKEVVARLIHLLDSRPNKRDLVVLDCASIVPELSGSEFFGHERGAFTGALTERNGAFALANDGTLLLDEIGDLPLPLQVQLLRVIQEHTYKRVGGNKWCKTEFRLICATNRDLFDLIGRGAFRADLYYRIAGYICKLPPLRE